ncbi:hypothetical protein ACEZDB_32785 [Streptacidiphilus sp. N1-3]|uniref:Uncharacterized protein n=1 Tax=Streptacidiphilus alkalitolerans TaxID=3342712 RepID=A0ABV6XB02_9ACTN
MPATRNQPAQPVHQAQQYNGGLTLTPGQGTFDNPDPFTVPPVPGHDGSGSGTTVNTSALDVFAGNIDLLITPTQTASTTLDEVSISPGAFYHANKIRVDVNGANGDDGLKAKYLLVLADLGQGLADLRDGIKQLSHTYSTVEDASHMTATDFATAMNLSQADFTSLITDGGGSGTTSAPGS